MYHKGIKGRNVLLCAASKGKKDIISYLHNEVSNKFIHEKDKNGHTAVTIACQFADVETVKLLKELGATINQTGEYNRNGLFCAIVSGKKDVIEYLHTQNNQLIHAKDKNDDTAITLACEFANVEIVKLLVKLDADINQTGKNGQNGLLKAVASKTDGISDKIIKYLNSRNAQLIHARDVNKETAITLGCKSPHTNFDTIKLLVDLGADVNQTGKDGKTGLLIAAKNGYLDIIKLLHSKNNQCIHAEDCNGDTAVTLACKYSELKTVKLLHDLGGDIKKPGQKGQNGLLVAATEGKINIIKFLHSVNSNLIHEKDQKGNNAVALASQYFQHETERYLKELIDSESHVKPSEELTKVVIEKPIDKSHNKKVKNN